MSDEHISDDDLERYWLGTVTNQDELAAINDHLLLCSACMERAEEIRDFVILIRKAIIPENDDPNEA